MDAMAVLKERTRASHLAIEAKVDFMRVDLDLGTYRGWLERLQAFHSSFESALDDVGASSLVADLDSRKKSGLLEADLMALGFPVTRRRSMSSSLPKLTSRARILGSLYVIEGSTLGAQLITRHLEKFLPPDAHGALAYFRGYGPETGRRWMTFASLVRHHLTDEVEIEEAVDAAIETFEAFGNWISSSVSN